MNRANVLSAADDENFPHMSEPTLPESRKAKASTAKWRKRFYLLGTLVLACVLIYLLGVVMGVLALPLSILVWCIIFIFCLYPLVDWLQERGIKRGLGTTIAYVVMIAIVALAVWLGVSPAFGLSDQFESINDSIPVYSQQFMDWYQGLASRYSALFQNGVVQQAVQSASDSFYQATGSFSNALASGIVNFGTFLVNSCIVIGFALVISFWILMDLPGIRREARRLVNPAHADDFSVISHTFNRSIGGYIKGTLLQCLIIGVACGVGYAIIGVPNAAACGVITGILNIIPVVGPWLGGIVAGGIGLMNSPTVAVISIIIAIIVQQVVYTFVSPIIMRDAVDIHPALMIFALMCGSAIGMYMGGLMGNIIGMLAAVPLTAAGKSLFVYFYEQRTGRQIVSEDGVFFKADVAAGSAVDPQSDATAHAPQPQMDKKLPFLRHHPARHRTPEQALRDRTWRDRDRLSNCRAAGRDAADRDAQHRAGGGK